MVVVVIVVVIHAQRTNEPFYEPMRHLSPMYASRSRDGNKLRKLFRRPETRRRSLLKNYGCAGTRAIFQLARKLSAAGNKLRKVSPWPRRRRRRWPRGNVSAGRFKNCRTTNLMASSSGRARYGSSFDRSPPVRRSPRKVQDCTNKRVRSSAR